MYIRTKSFTPLDTIVITALIGSVLMAEITLSVPVGPNPNQLIWISNNFRTEYPENNSNDEIIADDEQAEIFGRYAVGLYYTYYVRTFHNSLSENDVEILNRYCDELNWYIRASRDVVRRFDKLWNELCETRKNTPPKQDYLVELFDALGRVTRQSNAAHSNRDTPVDREKYFQIINRVLEWIRQQNKDSTNHRDNHVVQHSRTGLIETKLLQNDVNSILENINRKRLGKARCQYRKLYKRFREDMLERFRIISAIQTLANPKASYEQRYRLSLLLSETEDDDLFNSTRSALRQKIENTFHSQWQDAKLSRPEYGQLTAKGTDERISKLRDTIKGLKFPDNTKNLDKYYFPNTDDSTPPPEGGGDNGKGPCVAILVPIDPCTGQEEQNGIVAFSGCIDGSIDISLFFGYADNKYYSHKNGIDLIEKQLRKTTGDSVARISDTVEYFNQTGNIDVSLKEIRNKVNKDNNTPGNNLPRMFSCCERKLLADISPKTVNYPGGQYKEANLYIERETCRICYDAIMEFQRSRNFKCNLANPLLFVRNGSITNKLFDSFDKLAVLIRKRANIHFPEDV